MAQLVSYFTGVKRDSDNYKLIREKLREAERQERERKKEETEKERDRERKRQRIR